MSNRREHVVTPSEPLAPAVPVGGAPEGGGRSTLPAPDLVILREAAAGGDLSGAIARIRAGARGARTRILIVGEDDPPPPGEPLPSPALPMSAQQVARRAAASALREQGKRFVHHVENLWHFLDESRAKLGEQLANEVPAATRHGLCELATRFDYVEQTVADLEREAERTASGQQVVDVEGLVAELARHLERSFPGLRVTVAPPSGRAAARATAATLAEALFDAFVLIAHRLGGAGSITAECEADDAEGLVVLQLRGNGEPHPIDARERIERLRRTVVDELGGGLRPDAMGAGACGITVLLPRAARR